ncbi:MAG: DUF3313 domain-containing protein [Pseudomonadota bacterium]
MTHRRTLYAAAAPLLLALATGCSAPVKEQPRAGFISDYSRLEKTDSHRYTYTGPDLDGYRSFIIDRPVLLFDRDADDYDKMFDDDEIEELLDYYVERVEEELIKEEAYAITTEPAPGVARIRVGFTALDASTAALNLTLYTKVTGAGLGGAALEAEIVDSMSGEQLAASVQWGSGSRIFLGGYTKLGHAKTQINRWADRLRERLDELHGTQDVDVAANDPR